MPEPAAPSSFQAAAGAEEEILGSLLRWLQQEHIERSVIASHEGLVLVSQGAAEELAAAVSSMSNQWDSLSSNLQLPQQACVEVAYSDATHLYVFPMPFRGSRLVLGFEAEKPISEPLRQAIAKALVQLDAPSTDDTVSTETGE